MIKKPIYISVAVDQNFGIGKDGKLPWRIRKEIQFFKELTTHTEDPHKQNMVIMGRKTWDSIPHKFRPLPNRQNLVLSRKKNFHLDKAQTANSIEEAIQKADDMIETIYIIGGAQIFKHAMEFQDLTGMYITEIQKSYDCDTYYPEFDHKLYQKKIIGQDQEDGVDFNYYLYSKS